MMIPDSVVWLFCLLKGKRRKRYLTKCGTAEYAVSAIAGESKTLMRSAGSLLFKEWVHIVAPSPSIQRHVIGPEQLAISPLKVHGKERFRLNSSNGR